jgi:threonine dehydratase
LKACSAGGLAVGDAALMAAVSFAALKLKLVVEPGGAAALAAILSGAFDASGKTIAIVLSGGNIDPDMLQRCLNAVPSP